MNNSIPLFRVLTPILLKSSSMSYLYFFSGFLIFILSPRLPAIIFAGSVISHPADVGLPNENSLLDTRYYLRCTQVGARKGRRCSYYLEI